MTEHTKGPWHMGKAASDVAIYGPKGEHVATLPDMLMHDEVLANAALLIAAPDLLAALEYLEDVGALAIHPDDSEHDRDQKAQARAAIAKAKGE